MCGVGPSAIPNGGKWTHWESEVGLQRTVDYTSEI